jgi:hypothetical protein
VRSGGPRRPDAGGQRDTATRDDQSDHPGGQRTLCGRPTAPEARTPRPWRSGGGRVRQRVTAARLTLHQEAWKPKAPLAHLRRARTRPGHLESSHLRVGPERPDRDPRPRYSSTRQHKAKDPLTLRVIAGQRALLVVGGRDLNPRPLGVIARLPMTTHQARTKPIHAQLRGISRSDTADYNSVVLPRAGPIWTLNGHRGRIPTSRNARRARCAVPPGRAKCGRGGLVLQPLALVVRARRDHVVSRDVSQVTIGRDRAR